MKRGTTFFLKIAVVLIGVIVLALSIFWLPYQANLLANMYPEFSYLQYPLLLGLLVTTIPFFFALYQALKLLRNIDYEKAFSTMTIQSLKQIKYSALTISVMYMVGFITLLYLNAANPGILLMGLVIIFCSGVIAVFAALLQKLLNKALEIKSENELTV
ncbi:DUF2975 domain-containing protein [Oceanobacillus kapialis]|uniref:DUF2975 domain-containing protein n=1 Tax=Oceanobacillus kapialis TaxID=481353 RepID=UPI0038510450